MAKLKYDEAICPACAEVIKAAASKCKHCGHQISQSDIAARRAKSQADAKSGVIGCLVLAVIGAIVLTTCSGGEDNAENEVDAAADREAGFHCLSSWDGSHRKFVELVKGQLRDPSSFEHVETRVTPNVDGEHRIIMQYRARNGFGGMNAGRAIGTFDHETCVPSTPVISE